MQLIIHLIEPFLLRRDLAGDLRIDVHRVHPHAHASGRDTLGLDVLRGHVWVLNVLADLSQGLGRNVVLVKVCEVLHVRRPVQHLLGTLPSRLLPQQYTNRLHDSLNNQGRALKAPDFYNVVSV